MKVEGVNPDTPVHAYRGDMLCYTVSKVSVGADMVITERDKRGLELRVHSKAYGGMSKYLKQVG